MTPEDLIEHLHLQPHPEGGFYRETYRSPERIRRSDGQTRSASTAIYYMLCNGAHSAWHRIQSDEIWHFYQGTTVHVHELLPDAQVRTHRLGSGSDGTTLQATVQAGHWFAAELADPSSFALLGCTVAPGFDFTDFEMADTHTLLQAYADQATLIQRLAQRPLPDATDA